MSILRTKTTKVLCPPAAGAQTRGFSCFRKGARRLHIADGVLGTPVVAAAAVVAAGTLVYAARGMKSEDVPRVGLLAAAFFVSSLFRIPMGITSVHPVLIGLTGVMLGRRAPLAIFLGLLLQAMLFGHGGLTTLGVNTLIMGLPALFAGWAFAATRRYPVLPRGFMAGVVGVIGGTLLVVAFLSLSSEMYSQGPFSLINLVLLTHLPIVIIEGFLTGFAARLLYRTRPEVLGIEEQRRENRAE
ncbi:MAG: CbiM family transporter [Candidatus Desulforudaceae bacterium]